MRHPASCEASKDWPMGEGSVSCLAGWMATTRPFRVSTSKLPQWVLVGISIGFAMIGLERGERRTLA